MIDKKSIGSSCCPSCKNKLFIAGRIHEAGSDGHKEQTIKYCKVCGWRGGFFEDEDEDRLKSN